MILFSGDIKEFKIAQTVANTHFCYCISHYNILKLYGNKVVIKYVVVIEAFLRPIFSPQKVKSRALTHNILTH